MPRIDPKSESFGTEGKRIQGKLDVSAYEGSICALVAGLYFATFKSIARALEKQANPVMLTEDAKPGKVIYTEGKVR